MPLIKKTLEEMALTQSEMPRECAIKTCRVRLKSGPGAGYKLPMGNLSPEELQEYNQRMEQYEKAAREQMEQQKNGSLNTFQQGLKALNLPYEW